MNPLAIGVGWDPEIVHIGSLAISWHGLFSAVGIAAAVFITARFARRQGIADDDVYSLALWAVIGGLVGARLFYVIEHLDRFEDDPAGILRVNEGGITLYGGLIAGSLVAYVIAARRHLPCAAIADAAAMGMLVGQAFGRVGDLVNGEHCGTESALPWAIRYTNESSPGFDCAVENYGALVGVHPTAGGYELLFDLILLATLWLFWRQGWLRPPGYKFLAYVAVYATGRALLSELRLDEVNVGAFTVPQLVAFVLVPLAAVLFLALRRRPAQRPKAAARPVPPGAAETEPLLF